MLHREENAFSLVLCIMLMLCKAYQIVGMNSCHGLHSGAPPSKKENRRKNLRKLNFRPFAISFNPDQKGAQLFVGCPVVPWEELQNQVDTGLSSGTTRSQAVQPL